VIGSLKKLGKVAVITKKGDLLVRASKPVRLNSSIVNQELRTIGRAVDIIGPVSAPYIVVNTRDAQAKAKLDETLYLYQHPSRSASRSKKKPKSKGRRSTK